MICTKANHPEGDAPCDTPRDPIYSIKLKCIVKLCVQVRIRERKGKFNDEVITQG